MQKSGCFNIANTRHRLESLQFSVHILVTCLRSALISCPRLCLGLLIVYFPKVFSNKKIKLPQPRRLLVPLHYSSFARSRRTKTRVQTANFCISP